MVVNRLKLNDDKTEVINFSTRFKPSPATIADVTFGDLSIQPSTSVRNLGVQFDENLTMVQHVNKVVRAASYQIHSIGRIRRHLDRSATQRLVHALVTSRLDYSNSVLVGLPAKTLSKLQRVQNCAARLISLTKRTDHITPILRELHWLPIPQRSVFKVLTLVFKCLHNQAPVYLTELTVRLNHHRALRSSHTNLLVPRFKTSTYGARSFSVIGPKLWNDLPNDIKCASSLASFKSKLKTHLFTQVFN